jgi:hypothetical protein
MDPNEDTEWYPLYIRTNNRNDALRKHGILPEKPPDPNDEFEETLQRVVKEAEDNRLENLNLNELDELEDDEDEDFLESYRSLSFSLGSGFWRIWTVLTVDKRECRRYENLIQKVSSEQWNPSQNPISSNKSRNRVIKYGSLSIYSKISILPLV